MVAINAKSRSKPFVLFGSAGLALLLVALCAFSSHAEAASISRSLIGLKQELSKRTVTVSYAYNRMLANIGGAKSGADNQVPNVPAGTVVAAPSTNSPDYFYSWVRDSALTMKVVVSQPTLDRTLVQNYVAVEKKHQQNAANAQAGLGEPKFYVDGSTFTGPWGRPQHDGPALRASALIAYAKRIGLSDPYVASTLYKSDLNGGSVIKTDLEWVSHHWQDSTFDLWEEVNSKHFFNYAVYRRALVDGAKLATSLNDPGAATYYNQQAASIKSAMQPFWNGNYVTAYNVGGRSGLDCAVMLAALRGWDTTDTSAAVDNTEFGPASDKILATHKKYVDSFRSLYGINKGAAAPAAVATGRYQEDVYDGVGTSQGNPWYICTLSSAEVLNTAASVFTTRGSITITSISLPFFQQFASGVTTGTFAASTSQFKNILTGMKTMAKGFNDIVQTHSWTNGSLNEEFNRNTGFNQGARDLTWSYAAYVSNDGAANGQFLKV